VACWAAIETHVPMFSKKLGGEGFVVQSFGEQKTLEMIFKEGEGRAHCFTQTGVAHDAELKGYLKRPKHATIGG